MNISFWALSWLRMSYQYSNIQPMLLLIDVELRLPKVGHILCWSCSNVVAYVAGGQFFFLTKFMYLKEEPYNNWTFSPICVTYAYDLEGNIFCTGIMAVLGGACNNMIAISNFWTCSHMNIYIRISVVVWSYQVQHTPHPTSFQLNVAPLSQFPFICIDAQC